jgi:hypothetical protein
LGLVFPLFGVITSLILRKLLSYIIPMKVLKVLFVRVKFCELKVSSWSRMLNGLVLLHSFKLQFPFTGCLVFFNRLLLLFFKEVVYAFI